MDKEKMINLKIDGKKVSVPGGTTVLEAAKKLNIDIPTLCHHEALPPNGSCRICVVEMSVEKRNRKYVWVDAACVYPVEEDLLVFTDSTRVRNERKMILALLLSRAPDSAALLELADKLDVDAGRFASIDGGEANCILCGLCVRVCEELIHSNSIGISNRGVHKKVVTPYGIANQLCNGCTACAYVCPTGVIRIITGAGKRNVKNWETELEMQKCSDCTKTFAPVKYIEELKEKSVVNADVVERCPECRRKSLCIQ